MEAIVAANWKALRAKFSERPVLILRAVTLHALYNVGIKDAKIARIIYLTATNFYPYAKSDREKSIVESILIELAELAEKNAMEEWALNEEPQSLKVPTLKISGLKFNEISIDEDSLTEGLNTAAKPDPNTGHGPQHGDHYWQNHFSSSASSIISNVVNEAFSELSSSLSPDSIEAPINKFFIEFKKSLDQALKESFASIQAVDRRSKLLWWKETLYSSSLKNSYRSVNETVQSIIMSYDLYRQLPNIVPVSVDYLLKDTLLLVNDKAHEKIEFSKLLEQLSKDENTAILKEYFGDKEVINKRISITDFIKLLIHGKVTVQSLKQYTGIEGKEQISLTDFSVAILHDLMAEYLIPKAK